MMAGAQMRRSLERTEIELMLKRIRQLEDAVRRLQEGIDDHGQPAREEGRYFQSGRGF
jgi:hypothetical protein